MGRLTLPSTLLILSAGLALAAPPKSPPAAPATAPVSGPAKAVGLVDALPAEVRTLLKPRMGRHIRDLKALRGKVQAADWADVWHRAKAIADEPRIARPVEGATDTLNAALPAEFYEHQDALSAEATALAAAAKAQDVEAAEQAFDR
ncbi:MAG: hypothetical protein KC613_27800, partial [Myxococcales bacterium]|nr:hypothetical protein [Myxococcales bacterium]